jgi:hypothetical protein
MASDQVDLNGNFPTTRTFTVVDMPCDLVPNDTCFGFSFDHSRYTSYPVGSVDVTFDTLPGQAGLVVTDMDWSDFYNQPINLGVVTILFDSMGTRSVDMTIDADGVVDGTTRLTFYTNIGPIKGNTSVQGNYDYQSGDLHVEMFSTFRCGGPVAEPVIKIGELRGVTHGGYGEVSITTEGSTLEMSGFDFLISYDAAALTPVHVSRGGLLRECGWQCFSVRLLGDSQSGLLQVVAAAEDSESVAEPLRDGPVDFGQREEITHDEGGPEPVSCYGPSDTNPHELVKIMFLVTDDSAYQCQ